MSFNPNLDFNSIFETNKGSIYPVYINSRVIRELLEFCKSTIPKEALGFLIGTRVLFKEDEKIKFTKVTDWVTGTIDSTHISANFTTKGLEQANNFLDDKYGINREKNDELAKIIGIVHSHPFGFEPEFSHTDLDTFLNFPYDAEGNVFILIDPVSKIPFVKVYKIIKHQDESKSLIHVPWIEYSSIETDLNATSYENSIKKNTQAKSSPNNYDEDIKQYDSDDDPYKPPKIEDIGKSKKDRKKNVNMREFF